MPRRPNPRASSIGGTTSAAAWKKRNHKLARQRKLWPHKPESELCSRQELRERIARDTEGVEVTRVTADMSEWGDG